MRKVSKIKVTFAAKKRIRNGNLTALSKKNQNHWQTKINRTSFPRSFQPLMSHLPLEVEHNFPILNQHPILK